MSELSTRSGVATASIKFYQREGLVPLGERTSATQAIYDETHVDRLRLVRALIEVGGLSVTSARDVLQAIDNTQMPLDWAFGIAQQAASKGLPTAGLEPAAPSDEVSRLIDDRGWGVVAENPGRDIVSRVVETYRELGHDALLETLPAYADAALIVARADLAAVAASGDRVAMTQTVVVGTVLGDALFAGLRRIAQEHLSHAMFPADVEEGDC